MRKTVRLPVRWILLPVIGLAIWHAPMWADDGHGAAISGPAVAALKDEPLNLDKLRDFGTREYKVATINPQTNQPGEVESRVALKLVTAVEGDGVVLTDTPFIGGMSPWKKRTCAKDNYLSLRSVEAAAAMGSTVFKYTVANEQASTVFQGKTVSASLPDETLSSAAFLRIAPLLPQTAGKAWSVPHFIPHIGGFAKDPGIAPPPPGGTKQLHPEFVDNAVIRCVGPEVIKTSGKPSPCVKFTVEADKVVQMTVWVSADGSVKQFHMIRLVDSGGGWDELYVLPDK